MVFGIFILKDFLVMLYFYFRVRNKNVGCNLPFRTVTPTFSLEPKYIKCRSKSLASALNVACATNRKYTLRYSEDESTRYSAAVKLAN